MMEEDENCWRFFVRLAFACDDVRSRFFHATFQILQITLNAEHVAPVRALVPVYLVHRQTDRQIDRKKISVKSL